MEKTLAKKGFILSEKFSEHELGPNTSSYWTTYVYGDVPPTFQNGRDIALQISVIDLNSNYY